MTEPQPSWNPRFSYVIADSAQVTYDANHDSAGDYHCLKYPCPWHPGETRIRPQATFPASFVTTHFTERRNS